MVTQPYQRAKTSKISTKRLVKRPSREAGSCMGRSAANRKKAREPHRSMFSAALEINPLRAAPVV
jgi:hypothetical protein